MILKKIGYGRPGIKRVEIHVEIQDMETILDTEIILDMEVKDQTIYHTTIGRRRKLCHRSNKRYA